MKDISRYMAILFTIVSMLFSLGKTAIGNIGTSDITVNTEETAGEVTNIASNINLWDMGTTYINPTVDSENNIYEFVKYVQLMQCTGGTPERDLFKNPYDTSTYTDYDFSRLIENCRGILELGAKPHLKLGGVPIKFTSGYEYGGFTMNVYPPDDYNLYYDYIKAITEALVSEFGLNEVRTWRFGCMTEYENGDWFMAKSKTPEDSAEAFCKLYDYTVEALRDVLGDNVFVGAHSMTVTEGLWDEAIFIKHVAEGTNYANGKKGTLIKFFSASFYDMRPGEYTSGKTLPQTVEYLKTNAEKYGLKGLIYGIDEGRIYGGNAKGSADSQLASRTVGYTWQAAYDARLFKQSIDSGLDYFSSWGYLSNGLSGYPTISYHVAKNLSEFSKGEAAKTTVSAVKGLNFGEVDCLSSWDSSTNTLRLMVYNFKNDLDYKKSVKLNIDINVPALDGKNVTVTKKLVNDDCNFFDEWQKDRVTYNITDSCATWSPDDPCLDNTTTLTDATARDIYLNTLRNNYIEYAKLIPTTETASVSDGKLAINCELGANNVVFYEIKAAQ